MPFASRPVLLLIGAALLTFFLGLGRQAITDSDEGFYAEASREMVESGDWLTPRFNYEDRWQKPVLYYWVTSATYLVIGPGEFAARFASALSGLGLVVLTWVMSRRRWLAGAIVATCFGYFAMARLALPDLPLAFFITLGIWAALEQRWALAGAAAGLGFLTKGPVALVVPGIVLLPIWWREGTLKTLRIRDLAVAALVFAVIGLPWYAAMWAHHGNAYLESFFIGDNLERFATDRFNEPRAIWFYLPIVVGGLMPWAAYLLTLRLRRPTAAQWRLLLWALMPLLFYTVAIGKQPRYILPVLPPLAVLLAEAIDAAVEERRRLALPTYVTAAAFALLAVLLVRARPLFVSAYPTITWMALAALIGCALGLAWLAATARWRRLPYVMTAVAITMLLTLQFGALAGIRPEPVEQMAALIQANRGSNEPVGEYEVFVRNLVFYTRFRQAELFDEGLALNFIKSPERVLLVVQPGDRDRLQTIAGVPLRTLGSVQYLDTNRVRLSTLLAPIPAQDLETVLLVTNR